MDSLTCPHCDLFTGARCSRRLFNVLQYYGVWQGEGLNHGTQMLLTEEREKIMDKYAKAHKGPNGRRGPSTGGQRL